MTHEIDVDDEHQDPDELVTDDAAAGRDAAADVARQARSATKWALLSESAAKIIIPVTQFVLARILAPEAFGVLATVIMVGSFGEMLASAGFDKYLVQHAFRSKRELYRAANVAFWASMTIALALLTVIAILRDPIASLVGNPGLGMPILVACLSLPISVLVSSQLALFRRAFEYKKLVPVRIAVAATPLVVSVPLALLGFTYWSLIIGTLASALLNAVAMTIISPWKPRWFFSFTLLREMLSYSSWSFLEALSIWASVWSSTFIVGNVLTPHDLGLYRQPILVVSSFFALVTNTTTPILFAALSRLQDDRRGFRTFFFRFQFAVAIAVFPIGVGAFFYRDFFTSLLFGAAWADAALMLGGSALSMCIMIVFSYYCSEIYRSLGRPRVSFLAQCIYMAVMIPAVYWAALQGFHTLVIVSSTIGLVLIVINQTFAYVLTGFGFLRVMRNVYQPLLAATVMGGVAAWLSALAGTNWFWCILGIVACALVYAGACLCFPRTRRLLLDATSTALSKVGSFHVKEQTA